MIWLGILCFYVIPVLVVLEVMRCVWLEYRRDRIPILLYHRLICKADAASGSVADDEMIWVCYDVAFRQQMNALAERGWITLSLDEYTAIRQKRMAKPPKAVVITFDDGYASNYKYAFPALRDNGQKATIFVVLDPDEHTRRQVQGVDSFLTSEQMKEMADNGVDIQSHTLTHRILTQLSDEEVHFELSESRARIANITGRPVNHIAIPRAGYSRRIKHMVRHEGYATACCNAKGSSNGLSDPLALPRIVIERDMTGDAFLQSLEPRHGTVLRIMGNIKRIPERMGGAVFARRVRNVLYNGPLGPVFATHVLKRVLIVVAMLYGGLCVVFTWYLLRH